MQPQTPPGHLQLEKPVTASQVHAKGRKNPVVLTEGRTSTPSKGDEPQEELSFREEGNHQESVEVQSFHQEPAVVRHDAILKEDHGELTASLRKERIISSCLGLFLPSSRDSEL